MSSMSICNKYKKIDRRKIMINKYSSSPHPPRPILPPPVICKLFFAFIFFIHSCRIKVKKGGKHSLSVGEERGGGGQIYNIKQKIAHDVPYIPTPTKFYKIIHHTFDSHRCHLYDVYSVEQREKTTTTKKAKAT